MAPSTVVEQLVILVHVKASVSHGFGEGSPCRQAIRRAFPHGLHFQLLECPSEVDQWAAAARELVQRAVELRERHPEAKVHVVAHRHAGNIVLRTLASEPGRLFDSITCLGTPVLMLAPLGLKSLSILTALVAAVSVALLAMLILIAPAWGVAMAVVAAAVALGLATRSAASTIAKRADRYATALAFSYTVEAPANILNAMIGELKSSGEASSIGGIPVNLLWPIGDSAGSIESLATLASSKIERCLRYSRGHTPEGGYRLWRLVWIAPQVFVYTVALIAALIPFGWHFALAAPGLSLMFSTSPPGCWEVTSYRSQRSSLGMPHTYPDSEAAQLMESWLRKRFPVNLLRAVR